MSTSLVICWANPLMRTEVQTNQFSKVLYFDNQKAILKILTYVIATSFRFNFAKIVSAIVNSFNDASWGFETKNNLTLDPGFKPQPNCKEQGKPAEKSFTCTFLACYTFQTYTYLICFTSSYHIEYRH